MSTTLQLDTTKVDNSAGAAPSKTLHSCIPAAKQNSLKDVEFTITNRGTAAAYLNTAVDITAGIDSAKEIPANSIPVVVRFHNKEAFLPTVSLDSGAIVYITPDVEL